jgi:hypothetical protein
MVAATAAPESIGTLESPAEFVRAPLPLRVWTFKYKEDTRRVAWFVGDLGTTIVVMCGSAANFLDYEPEDITSGWWPSSPMGMKQIVDRFAGSSSEQSDGMLFDLTGEAARKAADTAAYISVGLTAPPIDIGWCGVVLRRYADVLDLAAGPPFVGRRQFDRVVVGAPLFVQRLPAE